MLKKNSFFKKKTEIRQLVNSKLHLNNRAISRSLPKFVQIYPKENLYSSKEKLLLISSVFLLTTAFSIYLSEEQTQRQIDDEKFPLHYKRVKKLKSNWDNESTFSTIETILEQKKNDYLLKRSSVYHEELSIVENFKFFTLDFSILVIEQLFKTFLTPTHEKIFARAEEIKQIYKDTHYVFIHGQSVSFMPVIYLINALAEKDSASKPLLFKYIRLPQSSETLVEKSIDLSKIKSDHKYNIRKQLLSVDAYFPNKIDGESAYYFMEVNGSVIFNNYDMTHLIPKIILPEEKLSIYYKEYQIALDIGKDIQTIEKNLKQTAPCGNLLVFCIPKDLINNSSPDTIAYRAHPYGKKCMCHDEKNQIKILQSLQDDHLDGSTKCTQQKNDIPQYRLLTQSMTPGKGILFFMLTPIKKEQRKKIKNDIDDILIKYSDPEIPTFNFKN